MFEGLQYQGTKHLPLKEIAKKVKAEIREKHPEIKVSVVTEHYSSIKIEVTAIPKDFQPYRKERIAPDSSFTTIRTSEAGQKLLDELETILAAYNREDVDSSTDYSNVRYYTYVTYSFQVSQEAQKRPKRLKRAFQKDYLRKVSSPENQTAGHAPKHFSWERSTYRCGYTKPVGYINLKSVDF